MTDIKLPGYWIQIRNERPHIINYAVTAMKQNPRDEVGLKRRRSGPLTEDTPASMCAMQVKQEGSLRAFHSTDVFLGVHYGAVTLTVPNLEASGGDLGTICSCRVIPAGYWLATSPGDGIYEV